MIVKTLQTFVGSFNVLAAAGDQPGLGVEVARPGQRRQLAPEAALLGQQLRLTSDPARPLATRH